MTQIPANRAQIFPCEDRVYSQIFSSHPERAQWYIGRPDPAGLRGACCLAISQKEAEEIVESIPLEFLPIMVRRLLESEYYIVDPKAVHQLGGAYGIERRLTAMSQDRRQPQIAAHIRAMLRDARARKYQAPCGANCSAKPDPGKRYGDHVRNCPRCREILGRQVREETERRRKRKLSLARVAPQQGPADGGVVEP